MDEEEWQGACFKSLQKSASPSGIISKGNTIFTPPYFNSNFIPTFEVSENTQAPHKIYFRLPHP